MASCTSRAISDIVWVVRDFWEVGGENFCISLNAAVLRPENEKSKDLSYFNGLGRRYVFALPLFASSSIIGPAGYSRPSIRPILSKASPAASSRVPPSQTVSLWLFINTRSVCPPDTIRAIAGNSGSMSLPCSFSFARNDGVSIQLAYICPYKWLTGISGLFQAKERVFAVSTPTSNDPISPGP